MILLLELKNLYEKISYCIWHSVPWRIYNVYGKGKEEKKRKKIFIDEREDNVEFTGPHEEKILVGSSGGRYYLKGKKKIYLGKKK